MRYLFSTLLCMLLALNTGTVKAADNNNLLNVSYDPTREFFDEYNALFSAYWNKKTGNHITVNQSHGGSGKQARSVIEGLPADVVTLAVAHDIDMIARHSGRLPASWRSEFPQDSVPFTSSIVFLVKPGNPKSIKDWNDLVRDDVRVIMANPKTSGGARWDYLAAWAYAKNAFKDDETKMVSFMAALYHNVPVLDTGARGSTMTFMQRNIGDVLVTWENEAHMALEHVLSEGYEIIIPSITIRTEPVAAVVLRNTKHKNTTDIAKAYIDYLYSEEAQELAAQYYYRPTNQKVAKKYAKIFPKITMTDVDELGGWELLQQKHFNEDGVFDIIYLQ